MAPYQSGSDSTRSGWVRRWFKPLLRLLGLLKYASAFALLQVTVPLAAYRWHPLHDIVGGLFVGLGFCGAFWVVLGAISTAWGVLFSQGLLVDDQADHTVDGDPVLPGNWQLFWNHEASPPQLLAFGLTALPTVWVCLERGEPRWEAGLGVGAAVVVSFLELLLLCAPTRLLCRQVNGSSQSPLRWWIAERCWSALARTFPRLRRWYGAWVGFLWVRFLGFARLRFVAPFITLGMDGLERRPAHLAHFFALTSMAGTVVGLMVIAYAMPPERFPQSEPPAGAYVFAMILLAVWVFGFLQFHLSRLRISPLAFILVGSVVGYGLHHVDHYYDVAPASAAVQTPAVASNLTPAMIAASGGAETNLVVVAASGGGILSAAWTTYSLHRLIGARPELAREIKLVSGVSGGSVGAAFYASALAAATEEELASPLALSNVTWEAFNKASASSLGAVTYGLAMVDLPRLFTGGVLNWPSEDRGRHLENAWRRHAQNPTNPMQSARWGMENATLRDATVRALNGWSPALIFGSTVMETGERLMLTGMDFGGRTTLTRSLAGQRAPTFAEYMSTDCCHDLPLWTAVRLSATFPYVTPAARGTECFASSAEEPEARLHRQFHLLDGGYYDNYGVAAALDWLEPVLGDRLRGVGPKFNRVLILQLRAFMPAAEGTNMPAGGFRSALAGPIQGLMSVYSTSAATRNDISVRRFTEQWNHRLSDLADKPRVASVTLVRRSGGGPLTWALTRQQRRELQMFWPTNSLAEQRVSYGTNTTPTDSDLAARWVWLSEFLEGTK